MADRHTPVEARTEFRYAVPISAWLPGDLPAPDSYPACAEKTDGWYAVIVVDEDEATVEDVRRMDWPLPAGVVDWRHSRVCERALDEARAALERLTASTGPLCDDCLPHARAVLAGGVQTEEAPEEAPLRGAEEEQT